MRDGERMLSAETFPDYVERRRRQMLGYIRRQRGWGSLLAAVALYIGLCGVLTLRPKEMQFGYAWVVATGPVTLSGIGLYLLGGYVLGLLRCWRLGGSGIRQRLGVGHRLAWRSLQRRWISLPQLVIVAVVWLGLALWGEMLAMTLLHRLPQVLAGVTISLILASSHCWILVDTLGLVEAQQLWSDYLNEIRQSLLLPHYHQLEGLRQSCAHYRRAYDELRLEEVEAYYWAEGLCDPLPASPLLPTLLSHARHVGHSCQQLSRLLYQLEEGIDLLEQVLFDIEAELDQQGHGCEGTINLWEGNLGRLQELDPLPLRQLSHQLVWSASSLQGVTHQMQGLLAHPTQFDLLSPSP